MWKKKVRRIREVYGKAKEWFWKILIVCLAIAFFAFIAGGANKVFDNTQKSLGITPPLWSKDARPPPPDEPYNP